MLPKSTFFIFIFSILGAFLSAQDCNLTLSGDVSDFDNSEHLEFTSIYIVELDRGVLSDDHGKFTFFKICSGTYHLKVSHLGCPDTLIKIELDQNKKIKIRIPHMLKELEGVEVNEHFEKIHTQTLSQLSNSELEQSKGKSLGEALKNINGISTINSGSNISKPIIHGMQGYRIMILNNGVRQEGQNWGNEHAPEIDPFIGQQISVLKGASAVRYGSDALGGVILISPKELPDSGKIQSEFNFVGFNNGKQGIVSGILEGSLIKIKGLGWRIQGTLKKGGNQFTPTYYLKNSGLEEKNFSYALGYHKKKFGIEFFYSQFNSKIGIFSGAHIGNLTDLQNAFLQGKPADSLAQFSYELQRPMQDIAHELIKVNTHIHTGIRSTFRMQYSWQYNIRKEFDKDKALNDSLAALNKPDLDYRLTTQHAELIWEHFTIKSFRGNFGIQYMNQKNVYLGRYLVPNFIHNTWGIFGIERYVKAHYELELGVRYDDRKLESFYFKNSILQNPNIRFQNWSGNIGYVYKPDTISKILINLASSWRGPAVNELYSDGLHHGVGAIERGNENLQPERCQSLIASYLFNHSRIATFEISGYTNYFQNYIYQQPGKLPELTIKGAFPVFNFTQTDALLYGVDIQVKKSTIYRFEFENKLSLIRGIDLVNSDFLIWMPSDRNQLKISYQFPETKLLKKSTFSVSWNHVNKQWRVPLKMDFAKPPPAYDLLGFDISTSMYFNKQKVLFGLAVTNALNKIYRDYLDRFRYYSDALGRNIQLRIKIPLEIRNQK